MPSRIVTKTGFSSLERRHSKFYSFCIYIPDMEHLQEALVSTKKMFPDATHTVYACRIVEKEKSCLEKYSDGGEPFRTAGYPSLELLRNHALIDTAIITLRQFGGTQLGKSNLLRAYLEVAQTSLQNATVILLEKEFIIQMVLSQQQHSFIMDHIKESSLTNYQTTFVAPCFRVSVTVKESRLGEWKSLLQKHQFYSYDIIEQKNEGGSDEKTQFTDKRFFTGKTFRS